MQALKVTHKICCSTWLIRGYPKLVGWSMEKKSFCSFLFLGYFFEITQHTSLGGLKSKHVASAASPEYVRRLEGRQQPHSLM